MTVSRNLLEESRRLDWDKAAEEGLKVVEG